MRILPRTVDVGVAQRHRPQTMLGCVELQVALADPLCDPVRADRIGRGLLGGGGRLLPVENPSRRGEHDPPACLGHRRIENVDQTDAVHLGIEQRLAHRPTHRHLRRLMADDLGAEGGEGGGHRATIADVDNLERNRGREIVARPGREVVDHPHLVPGGQERIGDVTADEARATRDHHTHAHATFRLRISSYTSRYAAAARSHVYVAA